MGLFGRWLVVAEVAAQGRAGCVRTGSPGTLEDLESFPGAVSALEMGRERTRNGANATQL
jgi:hypothetical protein